MTIEHSIGSFSISGLLIAHLILVFTLVSCGTFTAIPEEAKEHTPPSLEPTVTPSPLPTDTPLPAPIATPQPSLSGLILDRSSGQPVAGAKVSVETFETITSAEGHYILADLPPGHYVLSVTHDNYDPALSAILTLNPDANQPILTNLELYPAGTTPYPEVPLLTNPVDPNGAPAAQDAERLARLQGLTSEIASIKETKLSGDFLVNYRAGDELRAAVTQVRDEAWALIDATGQKWFILKISGSLATQLPKGEIIPTPEPQSVPPLARVVIDTLSVRACASETCVEIATLQQGTQLEVLGCWPDGSWCRVRLSGGESGWGVGQSLEQLALAEIILVIEPGGGKIAFLSDRDREIGLADIYLMNPDGSEQVRITNGLKLASVLANSLADLEDNFAWSDVHQRFYYSNTRGEFYSVSADGSNETLIAEGIGRFDLSPDGERVVFEPIFTSAPSEIAIMNIDGTDKTILTNNVTRETLGVNLDTWFLAPAWSPSINKIAFYAGGGLAIMNPDGTNPTLLVPPFNAREPFIWWPDSHYIAFKRQDGIGFDRVNIQDGSISKFFESGLSPAWSPDGSKIAFYKSGPSGMPPNGPPPEPDISQGEWQIWMMNTDGSDLLQLTFGGHNCCPVWVPQ